MTNDPRRIAFLKALIAAAWADGELSDGEIKTLSYYLQRLQISDEEFEELKEILRAPLPAEDAYRLLEEQLQLLSSEEDQRTLVAAVEDLLVEDARLHPAESEFLQMLGGLTKHLSTVQVFTSRLRALWAKPPPLPIHLQIRQGRQEVARFFHERKLESFRRRLARRRRTGPLPELTPSSSEQAHLSPEPAHVSDRDLHRAMIWAGLLSKVAQADASFCPAEERELCAILARSGELPETDLAIIAQAYRDGTLEGIDIEHLIREFMRIATPEEASILLDGLFLLAAADGNLNEQEIQTVHRITRGLGLPDAVFTLALQRCRSRLETGWN